MFPNLGFVQQLREYYYVLQAGQALPMPALPSEGRASKRQLDEDCDD